MVTGATILSVASGAGLLLAAAVMLRYSRRSVPAATLGAFFLMYGLQVLTIRWALLVEGTPLSAQLQGMSLAFGIPMYLFVAHFAVVFPSRHRLADAPYWLPVLVLPAVVTIGVIFRDLRNGILLEDGVVWGWATLVFVFLPFLGALVVVVSRLAAHVFSAATSAERGQCSTALSAFTILTTYLSASTLLRNQTGFRFVLGDLGHVVFTSVLVASLAVIGVLVFRAWVEGAAHRGPFAVSYAVPIASSALLSPVLFTDPVAPDLIGFWRLVTVAVLSYAMARHTMFDIDIRLRSWVRPASAAAVGVVVWGLLSIAGFYLFGWDDARALLALAIPGAMVALAVHKPLARRFDVWLPALPASEDYLARRKQEVYAAARASGLSPAGLQRLSAQLGVAPSAGPSAPMPSFPAHYRLERELAARPGGSIYLASDHRTGERVVVKEAARGAKGAKRFLAEAKVQGALDHPNILPVRDLFRVKDQAYIVTPYAEEGSLEDLLRTSGTLDLDRALDLTEDVLAGLAHLHGRGLIHRDVKPPNVFLRLRRAQLGDFDAAYDPGLDPTQGGSPGVVGTPGWLSPEQARGEAATAASDVYSAGVLMSRLLEHALPGAKPPLAVAAVASRAMAYQPEGRFPDAGAMLRALRLARRRPGPADAASLHGADAGAWDLTGGPTEAQRTFVPPE